MRSKSKIMKRKRIEMDILQGPLKWFRAGKPIDLSLVDYVDNLIKEEYQKGNVIKAAIGTDSKRNGRGFKFSTVILFHVFKDMGDGTLQGLGGKVMNADYRLKIYGTGKEGVKERMLAEVGKSIEVAYEVSEVFARHSVSLEVHADINPNPQWKSNKALSDAVGYILGCGYDFKVKPAAFASSFSADKFVQ